MKTYQDRHELLVEFFPKGGVCAEVGVCDGAFSRMIWEIVSPRQLHLIDVWAGIGACGSRSTTDQLSLERLVQVSGMFQQQIKTGRVILHQGLSVDVLKAFPDYFFDWAYLDADHSRKGLFADLMTCERKVRHWIAGHDIAMPGDERIIKHYFPGVRRAVDEFCRPRGWELIAVTRAGPSIDPDHDGRKSPSYVLMRK